MICKADSPLENEKKKECKPNICSSVNELICCICDMNIHDADTKNNQTHDIKKQSVLHWSLTHLNVPEGLDRKSVACGKQIRHSSRSVPQCPNVQRKIRPVLFEEMVKSNPLQMTYLDGS